MKDDIILEVKNLKQHFQLRKDYTVKAVDGISFQIKKGEVFGIVGESGSGKSTIARTIMGVYPPTEGEIWFKNRKISDRKKSAMDKKDMQKNMQIIFQDSAAALNPRMTAEEIIAEPAVVSHTWKTKKQIHEEVEKLLCYVGLDTSYADKYPNELSGGQRQRVAIARSISVKPDLILADEPIASLDISIQAQIINLFYHLKKDHRSTFLFIAHDLSVVRYISDRIAVMYRGKIVEMGKTEDVFHNPLHAYTKSLLSAIPVPDPILERNKKLLEFKEDLQPGNGKMLDCGNEHFVYVNE